MLLHKSYQIGRMCPSGSTKTPDIEGLVLFARNPWCHPGVQTHRAEKRASVARGQARSCRGWYAVCCSSYTHAASHYCRQLGHCLPDRPAINSFRGCRCGKVVAAFRFPHFLLKSLRKRSRAGSVKDPVNAAGHRQALAVLSTPPNTDTGAQQRGYDEDDQHGNRGAIPHSPLHFLCY
jgi:hypothetical protein